MNLKRRSLLKLLPWSGAIPFLGFQNTIHPLDEECITTPDIQGPFYIPNAPLSPQIAPANAAGEICFITGTVFYNDCSTPMKEALVDVWHANDAGGYEDEHYRGRVLTDEGGNYAFQTILPGKYLNGNQFRPRHFHYKVSKDGANELTTQIYFEGDSSIPTDPWASDESAVERIIPLTTDVNDQLHGVVDIVLDIDPPLTNGTDDQGYHDTPTKTYIRNINPNPVRSSGTIEICLKDNATISIECYALNGKLIKKVIDQQYITSGMHTFDLDTNNELGIRMAAGIYILRLLQNGVAVNAKRFMLVG